MRVRDDMRGRGEIKIGGEVKAGERSRRDEDSSQHENLKIFLWRSSERRLTVQSTTDLIVH